MSDNPKKVPPLSIRPSSRIAALTDGLSLQARMGASDETLVQARRLLGAARQALVSSNPNAAQTALAGAEIEFRKVDAKLSGAHEALISGDGDSKKELSAYVWILAADPLTTKKRTERIERLIHKLLIEHGEDGQLALPPVQEARSLLDETLSGRKSKPGASTRSDAVDQFENAVRQLKLSSGLDAYLDSGAHRDLVGYKITLGDFLIDTDILLASAQYKVALQNRILAHTKTHRIPPEGLLSRLESQEREAATALGLSGAPAQRKSSDPKRPQTSGRVEGEATSSGSPARTSERTTVGPVLLGVAGLGLVAIAGILLWGWSVASTGPYVPLAAGELEALSPTLVRGWMSDSATERSFVGQLSQANPWARIPEAERQKEAERLRDQLLERNVSTALLKQGTAPVFRIDGDQITYLE